MKIILFMAIFFSGSVIFSMNSTENRQALVDVNSLGEQISDLDANLNMLRQEGQLGCSYSQEAYEAFLSIADMNFPVISKRAMDRLAHYSLAYRDPRSCTLVVDNYKIDLWNKNRDNHKPRRNNG